MTNVKVFVRKRSRIESKSCLHLSKAPLDADGLVPWLMLKLSDSEGL